MKESIGFAIIWETYRIRPAKLNTPRNVQIIICTMGNLIIWMYFGAFNVGALNNITSQPIILDALRQFSPANWAHYKLKNTMVPRVLLESDRMGGGKPSIPHDLPLLDASGIECDPPQTVL